MIRSAGGSRDLYRRRNQEKVESDARILGDGDFVASLLREADHRCKRQLGLGEKRRSAEQGIQELCDPVGAQGEELRRGERFRRSGPGSPLVYVMKWGFPWLRLPGT